MPQSRVRRAARVLAWLPAALLVPAAMGGAIRASEPPEESPELGRLHPLDVGTTWVYSVYDDEEPSGTHARQITSQAGVSVDAIDSVAVTSRYTDYPGDGPRSSVLYLGVEGDALLQYGLLANKDHLTIDPPAPAYELPVKRGHTWSYDGVVGTLTVSSQTRLEAIEDVEVGGTTFDACAHYVNETTYTSDAGPLDPETTEEWTCPGYGPVRTVYQVPAQGTRVVEELVEFHGVDRNWWAETAVTLTAEPAPGTTLGFDAARTNAVPNGGLRPELAWSDARAGDFSYPPATDADVSVLAEEDGEVSARDVATGEMRWRVRLTGPVVAPPTLAGGVVLVADAEKSLWALRLDNGTTSWVRRLDDVVSVSPAVVGSSAIVLTDDGRATALDLASGETRWSTGLEVRARSAPAVADDVVVVSDPAGEVIALDLDDGGETWSSSLDGALAAGPAVADGRVLLADDQGSVLALAADDGSLEWEAQTGYQPQGAFAVGDDVVTLLGGARRLEAYDLGDGHRTWTREIEETSVSPVVVGDEVVTVSRGGEVATYALDDGSARDSWGLPAPTADALLTMDVPIGLADGALVFGGDVDAAGHEATMFAYPTGPDSASSGTSFVSQVRPIPSAPVAGSALAGDVLLVPGQDSSVYRSTPDGLETVFTSDGVVPGVTVAGDLLVAQNGDQIQAWPVTGPADEPTWRFPASEPFLGSVPVAAADTVFVPVYGLGLASLELDGTPRWFTPIDNSLASSPPLPLPGGDVVYGSGTLARYDGGTGAEVWSVPGQLFSQPAYDDGLVFADTLPQIGTGGLVAVDAETGRVRWRHDNPETVIFVGPAAADGVVVYADDLGLVTAFEAASGRELWRVQLATRLAGTPVISDGRVFLSEAPRESDLFQRDYRISAHDLGSGRFLGSFEPLDSAPTSTPSVTGTADGTLLVPATTESATS